MLTLLGKEFGVTLNALLEGRRLDKADFRAAAGEKPAQAMARPGERLRKWLAKYGTFTAIAAVLCLFLGMSIYVDWHHPEDVGSEHATFMYRAGWPDIRQIPPAYYISPFTMGSITFSKPAESIWSGGILSGMGTRSGWMTGRRPAGLSSKASGSVMWIPGAER